MKTSGEAMSPTLIPRRKPPLSRSPSKKSEGGSQGIRKAASPPKELKSMIRKPSIIDRLNQSGASYKNYLEKLESRQLSQDLSREASKDLKNENSQLKQVESSQNLEPIKSMGLLEKGSRTSFEYASSNNTREELPQVNSSLPRSRLGSSDKIAFIKNKGNSILRETGVSDSADKGSYARTFLRKKPSFSEEVPEPPHLKPSESRAWEELRIESTKVSMMINEQKTYNQRLERTLKAIKGYVESNRERGKSLKAGSQVGVDWQFLKLILQKRIICQDTRLS